MKGFFWWLTLILTVVGGLNWGLIAISPEYDLVSMILGIYTTPARVVYGLVGVSAVYVLLAALFSKSSPSKIS